MKIKTTTLLIVFIVLLGIVAIIKFFPSKKEEDTLKKNIINIDSAAIDKIVFMPGLNDSNKYSIQKIDTRWYIIKGDEKNPAKPEKIKRVFNDLTKRFEISRLASTKKEDQKVYKVDSSGLLVQIFENEKLKDQVIIGKLSFQNMNIANYYVRKPDEKNIYSVEAYLESSLKTAYKDWIAEPPKPDSTQVDSIPIPSQ